MKNGDFSIAMLNYQRVSQILLILLNMYMEYEYDMIWSTPRYLLWPQLISMTPTNLIWTLRIAKVLLNVIFQLPIWPGPHVG